MGTQSLIFVSVVAMHDGVQIVLLVSVTHEKIILHLGMTEMLPACSFTNLLLYSISVQEACNWSEKCYSEEKKAL